MAYLEIHDADGVHDLELDNSSLTVGRADECDLVVADQRMSKQHCRFELKNGSWRVVDLASANGTLVRGSVISQVVLKDGDVVEVGDIRLVFFTQRRQSGAAVRNNAEARARSAESKSRLGMIAAAVVVVGALGFVLMQKKTDENADTPNDVVEQVSGEGTETAATERRVPQPADSDHLDALRARFTALDQEAPTLLLGDLLERAGRLQDDAAGTKLQREITSWRDSLERAYRQRYEDSCRAAEAAIQILDDRQGEADGSGGVAGVLGRLDELLIELRANDLRDLERRMRKAKLRLLGSARSLWEHRQKLAEQNVRAGEFGRAREALVWASRNLAGTNFEMRAQSELNLLDLKQSMASQVPSSGSSASSETAGAVGAGLSAGGSALVQKITAAEKLAANRQWEAAAGAYDAVLTDVRDESLGRRWRWRRDLLAGLAVLKKGVITRVNEEGKRVRSVRIGRLSARPYAADEKVVQLRFGRAGDVTWKWREIPSDRLLDLLRTGVEGPDDWLAYARAAVEFGNDEAALAMLLKAAGRKTHKKEADRVYATWRGVDVPPGGFIVEQKQFFSPEEYADYEAVRKARKVAKKIASARLKQLPEIVAELRALGPQGAEPLETALRARYDKRAGEVSKLGLVAKPQSARLTVLKELEVRRKAAFDLIFDTKKYPYPYGPDQKQVQAEVDGLVNAVRVIYDSPTTLLLDSNKSLRALYDELMQVRSYMDESRGAKPDPSLVLNEVDKLLDMRAYGRSDADRKHNEEALVFNQEILSTITDDERECHRATNEYRMLMGLRAVKIEETLLLAARGHSQEMKDLGYFAHNSPTKGRESPSQRAQLAGWSGSCSENIARGQRTGKAAVDGWISSSGHHRNILGRGWTHLGCGKAKDGFFWTQNFAKGASTKLSKKKREDAGGGNKKRQ